MPIDVERGPRTGRPSANFFAGEYGVTVSGNWRLTFAFDDGDAVGVNPEDYD